MVKQTNKRNSVEAIASRKMERFAIIIAKIDKLVKEAKGVFKK